MSPLLPISVLNHEVVKQSNKVFCNDATMDDLTEDEPRLMIEELRQFPECEHYTDEEAQAIADSLMQLGDILYNLVIKNNLYNVGNQLEIIQNQGLQNDENDLKNAA